MMTRRSASEVTAPDPPASYAAVLSDVAGVIAAARRAVARSANSLMTAAYWMIGRRIVEHEQEGRRRAAYGERVLARLSADLSARFGRGFGPVSLSQMKKLYLLWPPERIFQTPSEKSAVRAVSRSDTEDELARIAPAFRLPWSAYTRLLSLDSEHARRFYETEAVRGGWSVRQLARQIDSRFYERTALSRNKAGLLEASWSDRWRPTPEEAIKDPYVIEFLGLKDEYSESDLEEALIRHLESFLLELGGDFCFVGRQRRLRVGNAWYRVDLVFFHRRLRCLVIIDLKLGEFTHADAGQMHLYLNYAREHWVLDGENPPVGLILCAEKDEAVAHYALEGLRSKVLAAEYRMALPDEEELAAEIRRTQDALAARVSRADRRQMLEGKAAKPAPKRRKRR